jgi:hypothetical protein
MGTNLGASFAVDAAVRIIPECGFPIRVEESRWILLLTWILMNNF